MPTKLYLLKGEIIKSERVEYDEVRYIDIDLNDSPIIENWKIIKLIWSATHKRQLAESKKMMDKIFPKLKRNTQ